MKLIIIENHISSSFYSFIVDKRMMSRVVSNWNKPDKIIVDLGHTKLFDKKRCWADLTSDNFKFLICGSFPHLKGLTKDQLIDTSIPAVDSLQFLVCAMIYYLETRSEFLIQTLTVTCIREDYLDFDFQATSSLELKNVVQRPGLKIVVDNTKESDEKST